MSGRRIAAIVLAAVIPLAVGVTLIVVFLLPQRVAEPPDTHAAAATSDAIYAALVAIDGVESVEDFGPYTDAYTKEIAARLVMDPASIADPYVVLEQGARVLWAWPEWEPTIMLSVERGDESFGANRLVDRATGGRALESADASRLFGTWPGPLTAAGTP